MNMMKILKWLAALPIIVAAVLFALAHAQPVEFYWSPVNDPLILPLYALALGLCAIGFILGALATWLGMGHLRHDRRVQKKTIKQLEKELAAANENILKTREEALPRPQIGTDYHG
jgi:hypothetical protein